MSPYPIPHIPWGDLATWIAGVASLLLFVVALSQIWREKRERDNEDIRRQAEQIAVWMTTESGQDNLGRYVWVAVHNQSPQPVYQVIVNYVALQDDGTEYPYRRPEGLAFLAVVPPGDGFVRVIEISVERKGVEIAFLDIKGRYWLRKPLGKLEEIKMPPLEYYSHKLPLEWDELFLKIPTQPPSRRPRMVRVDD